MSADRNGFTQRSIGKTFVLFVVTFGLYGLYWIHQLHAELKAETGADYLIQGESPAVHGRRESDN